MAFKSLAGFIEELEKNDELLRVKEFVDPELEITEVVDRISKSLYGGKAILFENNGTEFPVLINAMGSERRMCLLLEVEKIDDIRKEIETIFTDLISPKTNLFDKLKLLPKLSTFSSWMPKIIAGKGKCQQVIHQTPNLNKLPVLKCWPEDGGRFVTLPMVITKDPFNSMRNVGMYRMQVFDKNLTGMHWHKHKVGARHFNEYKKLGKKMPVAVALGGDLIYTYSATAPLPDNLDEFLLAGFLRKKRVELVKCITQDIEVPADADIIIEGYIDPDEDFILEGPFGDHTGFYSLPDWYPKFHVTCITHKKNAVYPATIVGVPPMEDAWIGKATERIFLAPIKYSLLPELIDYDLPFEGVAHNLAIIKINKTYAGQAVKVMNALWGAGQMMFNKIMAIVDNDVDIHNYNNLIQKLMNRVNPERDIHFTSGPLDVLDHSSAKFTYGSKMGIDATKKFEEEIDNDEIDTDKQNTCPLLDNCSEILKKTYNEIVDLNFIVNNKILIISLIKNHKKQIKSLIEKLTDQKELQNVKCVLFVDKEVDIRDMEMIVWVSSGNIDPKRDTFIIPGYKASSKIFIDATRKTLKKDNFKRKWPNVVVSDIKTVRNIDAKWKSLNIGDFIESPSLKYMQLNNNLGAVAKD